MFGKLVKYDMKSMLRLFVPLWLLAPIVSLLLSFSLRVFMEDNYSYGDTGLGTDILLIIMCLLFFGVMVALLVMTTLLIIQRFWNGLLKEEGYLMFTLPVEPWQLITSKGLTATIVSFVSGAIALISCVILFLASSDDVILGFLEAWNWFWKHVAKDFGASIGLILFLLLILAIVSTAESIYQIYAAMALGQFFQGHRVAGSCLAYLGVSIVKSVIGAVLSVIMEAALPDIWYDWYWRGLSGSESVTYASIYLLIMILISVVWIAVFHIITERILTMKLNLE